MKPFSAPLFLVIAAFTSSAIAATAPTAPANIANRGDITMQSDEGHAAPDENVPTPPKPKPHPRHVSKHR